MVNSGEGKEIFPGNDMKNSQMAITQLLAIELLLLQLTCAFSYLFAPIHPIRELFVVADCIYHRFFSGAGSWMAAKVVMLSRISGISPTIVLTERL